MTTQKIKTDYLDNEYIDPDSQSPETTSSPWPADQLLAKAQTPTDKQFARKKLAL